LYSFFDYSGKINISFGKNGGNSGKNEWCSSSFEREIKIFPNTAFGKQNQIDLLSTKVLIISFIYPPEASENEN
jgi:hypothetical protein